MSSSPSSTTTPSTANNSLAHLHSTHIIPDSLKFLISSLKSIVTVQLAPENYLLWKSQVTKLFTANGFLGYLDGTIPQPLAFNTNADNLLSPNSDATLWLLIDNNLSAALLSTISLPILPHLQDLTTCHEVWTTVHHRLQPTNRSRLTQLRQQLYTLSMRDQSMNAYLPTVKSHVDALSAVDHRLDPDELIHHILNGLPSSYQPFQTSIRTTNLPRRLLLSFM